MSTAIGRLAKYFSATPLKSVDFVANLIVDSVRNSRARNMFTDIVISGKQGMGKSTLALYIMYKYYDYDAERVLNNVFFTPEDLIEDLSVIKRELVLLDDAGVSLTKYRAMSAEAVDFVIFLNPIRTRVHGLLYTTVYNNIVKFVRVTSEYLVILQHRHGDIVHGVLRKTYVGRLGAYKRDVCEFVMDLDELHRDPDFHRLYTEYSTMREQFAVDVLKSLLERIRERRKKTL
ncbi:MAG: hypothetical protein QXY39_05965 [Thermofilaceae archaeon]